MKPDALTATDDKFPVTMIFAASADITNGADRNINHAALSLGLQNGTGNPIVTARPKGDEEKAVASEPAKVGVWTYVVAVVDLATKRGSLYVNGKNAGRMIDMADLEAQAFAKPLLSRSSNIGASSGGSYAKFNGCIDELWLQRDLRSEAWVTATYENQLDPAKSVALGATQNVN